MIVRSYFLIRLGFVPQGDITYQGNKEEGQVEGDDSGDELLAGWVFWFCL